MFSFVGYLLNSGNVVEIVRVHCVTTAFFIRITLIPLLYRDGRTGAWLISDTVRSLDVGWAYIEKDVYSPANTSNWKVYSEKRKGFFQEKVRFLERSAGAFQSVR